MTRGIDLGHGIAVAEYGGTCAGCGDRIDPGDIITSNPDGWTHRDCQDDPEPSARRHYHARDICPACCCQRPCWCGDGGVE